ncbi:MAG: PaeR7I family type II restriction endonuclease [Syntrophales bacterium LBB04]|nr:PaeR7I family type II restriction endonuclease [Syntrophales bacterium LBB04]
MRGVLGQTCRPKHLWTAYREGAFSLSSRPWLGYFMLLEETARSTLPVTVSEPHFHVFPEFKSASYSKRYEIFCEKLVRERLYDTAWFLMSNREGGGNGEFTHPSGELSFARFITSVVSPQ